MTTVGKLEKILLKEESSYCSYGDTVHYLRKPKIFSECDGSFLYDYSGMPYLDLQMWYSAVNLGYKNKRVNNAVRNQIDRLPQLASQYLHREKIELSAGLSRQMQKSFQAKGRIHFNVGGSQAIEDSIKIIRKTTGKTQFFAFQGSYHGRTIGASEITSSYRYRKPYGHFSNRAQFIPYPYCFRCHYGKRFDSCKYYCVAQFERLFETEYNSVLDTKTGECEFAAFYIEPIQGTGGYVIPPPDYFRKIKKILDRFKIYLVDDEIQMGFYRTGRFWGLEHFGIEPDILVFGKSLTNGMNPLSGLWAKEELVKPEVFPPGSAHSTFSSNPMGTTAGLEVMNILQDKTLANRINSSGKKFVSMVKKLQRKYKEIGDVAGIGLAIRIEVCEKDGITPNRQLADEIFQAGLDGGLEYKGKKYGLVLDIGGYFKNVFTLSPSFYITDEEIGMAYKFLDQLFSRFTASKRRPLQKYN
ncbi:MAG: aminotransferase class III-fold pyridoxal phosphate-dependent enzyme [Candidatus Omnitrophica bacterium]|nr:aminotransferase class III-fold pyridoxal phosphate-dependent enzyme [Candidatus Omnitrophota bacterium]